MTASGGLYPALGRQFKSLTELAAAGCMSRTRARDCLDGVKTFTEAEKNAISANIVVRLVNKKNKTQAEWDEMQDAIKAWLGQFEEIYKRKVV